MPLDAPPAIVPGNYVPSSQRGCHIAHHDAEWIIEAGDFDLEDYGLEPGDEKDVPEIIIDPETRSLRCTPTHRAHRTAAGPSFAVPVVLQMSGFLKCFTGV